MTGDRFYFQRTSGERFLRTVDHLRIDLYKGDDSFGARVEMTGDVEGDDAGEAMGAIQSMIDDFTAGK